MGKRGPQPTPTALNLLKGNPGKREINNNEPKFDLTENTEKPPSWLGTVAKKEWKRIFPQLKKNGIITDADYIALSAYCQNVDTWVQAEKLKRIEGLVTETSKGMEIQHPAVGIANTALANILKFGREFGLTPASRTNITANDVEYGESPFLTLMKKVNDNG